MKTTHISIAIFMALIMVGSAAAGGHTNHRTLIDGDDFVMPVIMTTEYRPINDTLPGDNISLLSVRYDRDKNGILTEKELRITYRDYMHSQLNPRESAQFIGLIGFVPIPAGHMGRGGEKAAVEIVERVEKVELPEVDTYIRGKWYSVETWGNDYTWSVNTKHYIMNGDRNNAIIRNTGIKSVDIDGNGNTVYVPDGADPTVYGHGEDNEVVPYSK